MLELQTDFARPAVMTTNGGQISVGVSAESAAGLWGVCRECGTTMMRGALAAWAVVLCKHGGQDDVVLGIPYANREHPGTQAIVGYFINTLAIRVRVAGSLSFRQVVLDTAAAIENAMVHAVVPFMRVVEAVSPVRDASRTPVCAGS